MSPTTTTRADDAAAVQPVSRVGCGWTTPVRRRHRRRPDRPWRHRTEHRLRSGGHLRRGRAWRCGCCSSTIVEALRSEARSTGTRSGERYTDGAVRATAGDRRRAVARDGTPSRLPDEDVEVLQRAVEPYLPGAQGQHARSPRSNAAELILLGNVRLVAYEQRRLQPVLERNLKLLPARPPPSCGHGVVRSERPRAPAPRRAPTRSPARCSRVSRRRSRSPPLATCTA